MDSDFVVPVTSAKAGIHLLNHNRCQFMPSMMKTKILRTIMMKISYLLFLQIIFTSALASVENKPDPVVIELSDYKVTLSEFNKDFEVAVHMLANQQGVSYTDQSAVQIENLRRQYLNQRATEIAFLQEAERRDISLREEDIDALVKEFYDGAGTDNFQDIKMGFAFENEEQLRKFLMEKQILRLFTEKIAGEIAIRPGDVVVLHHDIQNELAIPEQICMRHIVLESESSAHEVMAQLREGSDFEIAAREKSIDVGTAEQGGDIGCFAKQHMVPRSDFERAAFNAKMGELTGPVQSEFGYHLIIVYDRRPARVPSLNEIYDELEQELKHEELPKRLSILEEESGVVTYPDRLDQ